ncbi:MAG: hypothetical protein BWY10_02529 [Chloroflexi bacterium ADurb.Bin180]|nr:MAG: hypothetical protein BWY10_02529 [Chloroflexi bacterium ADurb.Bin180]
MSQTFKRSLAFLLTVIILFGCLWFVGYLDEIRDAQEKLAQNQSIGVASTSGVFVEQLTMTSALTHTVGYGQQYGFITSTNAIYGELLDIYIDYTASISATTDITVSCLGLLTENLLVSADSATDAVWRPRVLPQLYTGVEITPTMALPYNLQGKIVVNIAETSGVAPGVVYIRYRR